jgi:hypothetical protein
MKRNGRKNPNQKGHGKYLWKSHKDPHFSLFPKIIPAHFPVFQPEERLLQTSPQAMVAVIANDEQSCDVPLMVVRMMDMSERERGKEFNRNKRKGLAA